MLWVWLGRCVFVVGCSFWLSRWIVSLHFLRCLAWFLRVTRKPAIGGLFVEHCDSLDWLSFGQIEVQPRLVSMKTEVPETKVCFAVVYQCTDACRADPRGFPEVTSAGQD